jgi:hypothetical protein
MSNVSVIWDRANQAWVGPRVDGEGLASCESYLGVKLPDTLKVLYAQQNGGFLSDPSIAGGLFALAVPGTWQIPLIKPATHWAEEGQLCDAADVRWLNETFGNASLILPVWREGRTCYALNYNARGVDHEPNVIWLDFECGGYSVVAGSFGEWIDPHDSRGETSNALGFARLTPTSLATAKEAESYADTKPSSRVASSAITTHYESVAKRLVELLSRVTDKASAESLNADLTLAVQHYQQAFDSYLAFASSCEDFEEIAELGRMNQAMFPLRHAISEELVRLSRHAPKARKVLREVVARLQDMDIT